MTSTYDVAVVGGGIVGLAHAYAAAKAGLTVALFERQARATGASIRNFGFVTVTGQQRGAFHQLAQRSRDIWQEVAGPAGIAIEHRGLYVAARYAESEAVLRAFLETEMGEGCELLRPQDAPFLAEGQRVVLHSPHDLRVESRTAIPLLSQYLSALGVARFYGTAVTGVEQGRLTTSQGEFRAERIIVCPGDDLSGLFADRIRAHNVSRCQLQMLRLEDPGLRLPGAVMSDLSLVRYLGYSDLPEARALTERLRETHAEHIAHGVHLIVVQSADGSIVVGDSHHYDDAPEPFATTAVDDLILDEYRAVLGAPPPTLERWTGTYAVAPDRLYLIDAPLPDVRLCVVTCGAGASTAFAIAEHTFNSF
ncbi:TIGR03364 family FAD-dependent oxidoreductase [Asticcacaulis sp. 201]|uniref:TIGR03364 family FAD-dependent oxidoreductase n=1 Tax=Asticcacaulis sp. 201 TaxID=3028787 RepID=UPI002915E813|nr:TIGR03364 family FAD-dependent oxidoreductase [Asticcacaulis sp. 201]MDV6330331.1 TIGR03364 family FAD-dependent oxidoreductase [Asticcacaulis sp. 201]